MVVAIFCVVLASLASLACIIAGIKEAGSDPESGLLLACGGVPLSALLCLLLCGGLTAICNVATDHRDEYTTLGLEAIRDGSSINGEFVLGTGILTSDATYTFYANNHGAIHLEKVDASEITLYEDSGKPYVIEYTGCQLEPSWLASCLDDGPRYVEIHVPPGSVKNQINLNLNGN